MELSIELARIMLYNLCPCFREPVQRQDGTQCGPGPLWGLRLLLGHRLGQDELDVPHDSQVPYILVTARQLKSSRPPGSLNLQDLQVA